ARPVGPGLGGRVRRRVRGGPRTARPPREQRGDHGTAARTHQAGVRASDGHEPLRPLRPHRTAPSPPGADAGSRVVVVSSTAQKTGRIDFDDLDWERRPYKRRSAYEQSKLANMLFTLELQRRLAAAGSDVRATAAHPGWTATDITRASGRMATFVLHL